MELLAAERKASRLNTEQITNLLFGGEEMVKRKREIENAVANDPNFDVTNYHYQNTEEKFEQAVRKFTYSYTKKMPQLKITGPFETHLFRRSVEGNNPYAIHGLMFTPTIEGQGTQEQKNKWLPLIENYDILGCYAQTEMGHGTYVQWSRNVQQLMTAAKHWNSFRTQSNTHFYQMVAISSGAWELFLHTRLYLLDSPEVKIKELSTTLSYS